MRRIRGRHMCRPPAWEPCGSQATAGQLAGVPRRRAERARRVRARAAAARRTSRSARGSTRPRRATRRRRRASSSATVSGEMSSPPRSIAEAGGTPDRRRRRPRRLPSQRRKIHSSTRMFSPYPGPQEVAVGALAEPVDVEDARQLAASWLAPDRAASRRSSRPCCSRRTGSIANGSRRSLPTAPVAAAVVSDAIVAPRNTPCSQSNASYTSGTTLERRPPSRNASIGTPRRVLPLRRHRRVLPAATHEARVRVRRRRPGLGRPVRAVPVDQVRRRRLRHPLPPDVAVVGARGVGEDRVGRDHRGARWGWSSGSCPARRRRSRPPG